MLTWAKRGAGLGLLCLLLGLTLGLQAQLVPVPPTSAPRASLTGAPLRSQRLGITFINSAQMATNPRRYQQALELGAGWNRFPLYWDAVESAPDVYDWAAYDAVVAEDVAYGLQMNVVLLGMPSFRRDGNIPSGLNAPVFTSGSDFPSAGATLNPENSWANFVYQVVMRYKPNGTLAQAKGWRGGQGVRVWEMWNEPDLAQFWGGGIANYARLLKVAYIVTKLADPQAQVMFGGLLYPTSDNWLARVMAIYDNDPQGRANNFYFDIVSVHSYSYAWRSGWLVLFARQTLVAYKVNKPIWLNESGVSVWDDYPGKTWTADAPNERKNFATAEQQAWYFIQSSAYAWSEGADVVFYHQLYDDCGDQAAGTDFPPHNGSLCADGRVCWGNAFGIFRNERGNICFGQHPQPATPRPIAVAYRLMADIFGTIPFVANGKARFPDNGSTVITFDRPTSGERIRVIWNRRLQPNTVRISAQGDSAQVYSLYGNTRITPNAQGEYVLDLPAAKEMAYPEGSIESFDRSPIGGAPFIVIELPNGGLGDPAQNPITAATTAPLIETPIPIPTFRPTTAPDADTTPPEPFMNALPVVSPPVFDLAWGARDNGAVVKYLVWVKVNDGEWLPYLETSQTQASYTGIVGNVYRFAVWAQDEAGNWSTNTALEPMAVTKVE